MRVLVTGASGFIGRHVVAQLVEEGEEVVATARRPPSDLPGAEWRAVDLLRPGSAAALVREVRPTHLVHLAWNVTPGRFWRAADNLDWAGTTLRLCSAFLEGGGEGGVFAGTCAEYGWSRPRLHEADLTAPVTFYGRVKDSTRTAVLAAGEAFGPAFAWGRVFWVYGPREAPGRLVSDLAAALARGQPAELSEGRQARDFLHVADVAGAFIAALRVGHRGVFNIASGQAVPICEVAERLAAAFGRPDLLRLGARPSHPDEPSRIEGDNATLAYTIGFRPRFGLDDGLEETALWWRDLLV